MSTKKINIILFGIESVGSSLIKEVLKSQENFLQENNLDLRLPIITNSTVAFFEKPTVKNSWEANFIQFAIPFKIDDIINFVQENELENLIAIDTTETEEIIKEYFELLQNDFDIISSNPAIQNISADFNVAINAVQKKSSKEFHYINPSQKQLPQQILKAIINLAEKPILKIAV